MVEIRGHRVLIQVEVGKVVFVTVAKERLIRNEDIADHTQHGAEFLRQRLSQKILRRPDVVREKWTGFNEAGVLRDVRSSCERVLWRASVTSLGCEVKQAARPQSRAGGIDVE